MSRKLVLVTTLVIVLMGILGVAFDVHEVRASGTIYIRADGRVDPPEAEDSISSVDNVTYIFTKNIQDSIVVERDNIVVDGAGYTLQGAGNGKGIELSGRSNVTIQNVNIEAFDHGIYLYESSGNGIYGNNITANNDYGIMVDYSSNNSIVGNIITANNYSGIEFSFSENNKIRENDITNNLFGVSFWDSSNNLICHNNFGNNTFQFYVENSVNVWDDGYPSGGNNWSDYAGLDLFSGFDQNITGSDGIGETSYFIMQNLSMTRQSPYIIYVLTQTSNTNPQKTQKTPKPTTQTKP